MSTGKPPPPNFWQIATAIGVIITATCLPVLTFVNSNIKQSIDDQFGYSAKRVEQTKDLFQHLSKGTPEEKRLAILLALAYADEDQFPVFILPVLAIHEANDPELSKYLETGLNELRVQAKQESVRNAATRALARLLTSRTTLGGPVSKTDQQKVAEVALQLSQTILAPAKDDKASSLAKQALSDLAPGLASIAVSDGKSSTGRQAIEALSTVEPDKVEEAITQLPEDVQKNAPWRVYLHVVNSSQLDRARAIADNLTRNGYLVPGIQNLEGTKAHIPDVTEVRFFAKGAMGSAEKILAVFKADLKKGDSGRASFTASGAKESADHFEVWFSKNAL